MKNLKEPSDQPNVHQAQNAPFIVGIGASAGGLASLERFFSGVPKNPGCAFVVVMHLSSQHKSYMQEILSRKTELRVENIKNHGPVSANVIYLLPPGFLLTLAHNCFGLKPIQASDEKPSKPIDHFFESLAQYKNRCAAVVLSGTGRDGSSSIGAIAKNGGFTLVEDPKSASFDGMPNSSIDSGVIDVVAAAEEMPEHIMLFTKDKSYTGPFRKKASVEDSDPRASILSLISNEYGVNFSEYKTGTIDRRIERRLASLNLDNIDEYEEYIQGHDDELSALYHDFLIGVTSFFRDKKAFDIIRDHVLPNLLQSLDDQQELRVWVPGCATGEEVYSIVILFHEICETRKISNPPAIKVFGTDIDPSVIEKASKGNYDQQSIEGLDPHILEKYFHYDIDGFTIKNKFRKCTFFTRHNILSEAPFTKIHFISCRNLLIYFTKEAQNKFFRIACFSLLQDGYLFLGPSETITDYEEAFAAVDTKWKVFRKGEMTLKPNRFLDSDFRFLGQSHLQKPKNLLYQNPRALSISRGLETLLQSFVPPSIMIGENYEILHIFGNAGSVLSPKPGHMSTSLRDMIDKETLSAVTVGIHRSKRDGQPIDCGNIKLNTNIYRRIRVQAFTAGENSPVWLYLVSIYDEEKEESPQSIEAQQVVSEDAFDQIQHLETELQSSKENLQTTVEELEATNEELQSTNEELLASNEELQSTNEELHSVNQELHTINNEFQEKIHELTQMQEDEENLMSSTDAGTIFLDSNLKIRRCSKMIAETFNILPQDIGRPVEHVAYNIRLNSLLSLVKDVQNSKTSRELEIQSDSGNWYLLTILPFRRSDGSTDGIVLSFVNIDSVRESREIHETVFELAPLGLLLADASGELIQVNGAMRRMFGYDGEELIGRPIETLVPERFRAKHPKYREMFLKENTTRQMGQGKELSGVRKDGSEFPVEVGITTVKSSSRTMAIATVADLTEARRKNLDLQRSNDALEQFAYAVSHDLLAPIRHISQYAGVINEALGDYKNAEVHDGLKAIELYAHRVRDMIDGILNISRIDSRPLRIKEFDSREQVQTVVSEIDDDLKSGFEIEIGELPTIHADEAMLRQVFTNLIGNAIKFSEGQAQPRIEIGCDRKENDWEFWISDNGIGIEESNPEQLFKMFKRSQNAKGTSGTGIGLSTCQKILERHGGKISAQPKDEGAKFIFRLPSIGNLR